MRQTLLFQPVKSNSNPSGTRCLWEDRVKSGWDPEGIIEARAETVGDAMEVITRAENCARYLQSSGRKVGMKRNLPGKH